MASNKWKKYQNMTTRAKKFGGADNYQAFLIFSGLLGGVTLKSLCDKFKSKRNGKIEDKLLNVTYEVTNVPEELSDELGDAKDTIKVGSKIRVGKVLEIEGEKSLFIEIEGDDNNPYLLKEEIVEKISNYKFLETKD